MGEPATGADRRARILVLGSLNMDVVVRVARVPAGGETIDGRSMGYALGGKGANQAVSCARQGAQVALFGALGDDAHGEALRQGLQRDGVELAGIQVAAGQPSGSALVLVDDAGQNRIVVIPGANALFDLACAPLAAHLASTDFLVLQFETPLPQVLQAMALAQASGTRVLLNPSPAQALPDSAWSLVDTLVVNEGEAAVLSGQPAADVPQAMQAAHALLGRGVRRVVVTLGERGAVAADAAGCRHHAAVTVPRVVDTTAAGDTFLGALAVLLAEGRSLDEAVQWGIRAAALCIQVAGAQPSIPTRAAVARSPVPSSRTSSP